jgi:dTDP-4-dehydrorhamnose 3,5-epimerase
MGIEIINTSMKGVNIILPLRHNDSRGFFSEIWNIQSLEKKGINLEFVQENHSLSYKKGTLRGLHFQKPPHAQLKLVRCGRGSFLDVFVDLRSNSASYGKWGSEIISFDNRYQIIIPEGFAHGFIALEDSTEIIYKCSEFYTPSHEITLKYDDPDLKIDWILNEKKFLLSEKDKNGISFKNAANFFI